MALVLLHDEVHQLLHSTFQLGIQTPGHQLATSGQFTGPGHTRTLQGGAQWKPIGSVG